MAKHKCRPQGDHIVRIAREKGYHDWKRVWHENGPLKSKRANPLVLFKGDKSAAADEVTLPPKKNHTASQSTGEEKKYVVPKPKLCLRLRILFGDFTPLEDASYELTLQDGTVLTGKTDAAGRIKVDSEDPKIADTDTTARLVVRAPPQQTGEGVASDVPVVWDLKIGALNPIMESAPNSRCLSGVQARLNNLGLDAGPVDGIMGANTKAAIEAFQSLFNLDVDGIPGQGETQPKLVEVYDEASVTGPPPGEKEIKHPVPDDKKIKTENDHIGHVAPDFLDASTPFVNALVLRPQYRVTLELGNLEDLYRFKSGSDLGRIERLQVAGLHYYPMGHDRAGDALASCWTYWEGVLGGGDDAALEERARNFVIDGWTLPEPAPDGEDPKAAPDKHYRKIRVPGGHNYRDTGTSKFHPLHDSSYPLGFGNAEMHEAEAFFMADNPVVGSIPLLARVEQRFAEDAEWKPAPGAAVHFQLVEPYELPDFDENVSPAKQLNRPPLFEGNMWSGDATGAGPHKLDQSASQKNLVADHPEVDNAPNSQGGKRGLPVRGNHFETDVEIPAIASPGSIGSRTHKPRPGFQEPHEGDRAGEVQPPFFHAPKSSSVKHAVSVEANEAGVAGVVFRPSTKGGDRYRLRAFLGEPTYDNDGTGSEAIAAETGTFVVWRNARMHKALQLAYDDLSDAMLAQFNSHFDKTIGKTFTKDELLSWLMKVPGLAKEDGTKVGYPTLDLAETGDPDYAYDSFTKEMARAFCEIEYDPGFDAPEEITDERWRKAMQAAADFAKLPANNTFNLDIDKLLMLDAADVDASNSHVFIALRTPLEYNKLIPAGSAFDKINCQADGTFTAAVKSDYDGWFDDVILGPFVHSLVEGGLLPAMWLVQMPTISSWHRCGILGDYSIGLGYSCTVLNGGKDDFPHATKQDTAQSLTREGSTKALEDTGFDGLVTHELGHCMFRLHAPPDPAPSATAIHDPIANVYCVMTYKVNEGHFCAKCLFALRGWSSISAL